MTALEFRAELRRLGLTQVWLAQRLGVRTTTVNRWAMGTLPVPQYAAYVLWLIGELNPPVRTDRPA
jgi:DNA-binding transcriptional regulator YiaG